MRTDASIDEPTATTATWKSCAPICLQGVDVAGVGLHGVGDALRPLLHELEAVVDREHLAIEPVELARARGAEAPESDHEDGRVAPDALNQRSAFPPAASRAANGMSRPRPRRESLYQCDP